MKYSRQNPRRRNVLMLALASTPLLAFDQAWATNKTYIAANSDWLNSGNWSPTGIPVGGANPTTPGDNVNFSGGSSHILTFDDNYSSSAPLGTLTVDDTGGFTNTLLMPNSADTLTLDGAETVGLLGQGVVNQSAGVTNIVNGNALTIGFASTSIGTYILGNGTTTPMLSVTANEAVAWSGTGNFNQNSGTHTVLGTFYLAYAGGNGTYMLNSGNFSSSGTQYIGYSGTAVFNQTGGINSVGAAGLYIAGSSGGTANATGTYSLSNSAQLLVTGPEYIGDGSSSVIEAGTFNQSGGTHAVNSSLYLGTNINNSGSYLLSGNGTLNTTVYGSDEYVGFQGSGSFNQTGGTNNVGTTSIANYLVLGFISGSVGTYSLSSTTGTAVLNSNSEIIGGQGNGIFNQSGGTNNVGALMQVGGGSVGSYTLTGGVLNAGVNALSGNGEQIGYFSNGIFNQSGGANNIGSTTNPQFLDVGENTPAVGTYLLSGPLATSTLTVNGTERIGLSTGTTTSGVITTYGGTFNQSGGTHTVTGSLMVGYIAGSTGQFLLSGGTLTDATLGVNGYNTGIYNEYIGQGGVGVFNQTGGTHTVGASISDGRAGDGNVASLIIGNSGTATGSYILSSTANSASLYVHGSIIVGNGSGGSISSPNATFTQNVNTGIVTGDGIILGNANASTGLYTMNGGTFSGFDLIAGPLGTGVFNQTGGVINIDPGNEPAGYVNDYIAGFEIGGTPAVLGGFNPAAVGIVNLGGNGTMNVSSGLQADVGYGTTGTFNQFSVNSTANFSGALSVGTLQGAVGIYNLSAGTLNAANEYIGNSGNGTFLQSGGTNTIGTNSTYGSLIIGFGYTAFGGYILNSGGQLTVNGSEVIGYVGPGLNTTAPNGIFTQYNGSTHTIVGQLFLGQQDPIGIQGSGIPFERGIGQYNLGGGTLTTSLGEYIGWAGTGIFNQSGGTNTIGTSALPAFLTLGYFSNGLGTYNLNNAAGTAQLTVYGPETIGEASNGLGTGGGAVTQYGSVFNQSAAAHTISGSLTIADQTSATGLYLLSGSGSLTVTGPETIGNLGTGTFLQSGGTNTIGTSGSNQPVMLGNAAGATSTGGVGVYVINNASAVFMDNGSVYVGGSNTSSGGTGLFNISAGSATITGMLKIWNTLGSAVNLTGGLLSLNTLDVSGNLSRFNWTGGTLNFVPAVTIDSNFVLTSSVTLSGTMMLTSSASLTNNGTITLAGGGIGGAGPITNNALITGYGTINGSGGFVNNAELSQGAGNLTLANTGVESNIASIDLSAGHSLILQSTSLTNTGTVNVNGAIISGSGTLINATGGTVAGRGTISAPISNATGATIIAQGGTLAVPAFNNTGAALVTAGATLTGGLLTNPGRIGGAGTISNAISNTGTIEAVSGILILSGSLTNTTSTGIIYADPASDTIASAFPTNAATIELDGGTFETSNQTLSNTGTITGYGRLRTGGLTNTGTILFAGGSATLDGSLTNNAAVTVQNTPALFTGLVTNNGTFRVISSGSATFANGYTGGSVSNSAVINTGTFSLSNALIGEGNFTNSGSLSITGTQTWIPGTTFTNTAGSASFATDAGTASPGGEALTVLDLGGTVAFSSTQHLAGLNISSGATTTLTGAGNGHRSVLYTPSLAVAGNLDLTANDLDVQGGSLSTIRGLVAQAFNNGRWNGTGITSSVAAADSTHLTALGVILSVGTTLDGLPVAVGDVLVKYTYYGDANLDGKVDGSDYSRIDSAYLADRSNPTAYTGWYNGDFNYDSVINGSDYTLMDNAFNTQSAQLDAGLAAPAAIPTAQIAGATGTSSVPEPTSLAVLSFASAGILSRRRNRRTK